MKVKFSRTSKFFKFSLKKNQSLSEILQDFRLHSSATFGVTHAILPQNQNVALASTALQRPTFPLFLAAKSKFSLAKLVPKKSLRNGDDFDAKIGTDSPQIYGLSMIYGFYVVQAKFRRDEQRRAQLENI